MVGSALRWLGCAVLVLAGYALLVWLPQDTEPDGPQSAEVTAMPGREDAPVQRPAAQTVSLPAAGGRP